MKKPKHLFSAADVPNAHFVVELATHWQDKERTIPARPGDPVHSSVMPNGFCFEAHGAILSADGKCLTYVNQTYTYIPPMKAFFAEVKSVRLADTKISPVFETPWAAVEYAEGLLRCARLAVLDGEKEVVGPVMMCVLKAAE